MSFKLYELTEMYQSVWDLISDDEVDLEAMENALSTIEDTIESKAESIAKLIKSIDSDMLALETEEKRLYARRKALSNKQKGIKDYLEYQLKSMGVDKVKTPLFTVALQNNPPSVNVLDESLVPSWYSKTVTTTSLVKKDILDALKRGIDVPGVEMKQDKSLRIR